MAICCVALHIFYIFNTGACVVLHCTAILNIVKKRVKPWSQGWLITAGAYLQHEAARSTSTSPGRDASTLQVTPL